MSSLTDADAKSGVVTSFNVENKRHKDDAVAGPSTTHQISDINNSPQTSSYVSSRTPTPTNISPQMLGSIDVLSRTTTPTKHFPSTESKLPTRTGGTKRKRLFIYIFTHICQNFF